jgi:hypothetical protein
MQTLKYFNLFSFIENDEEPEQETNSRVTSKEIKNDKLFISEFL